MLKGNGCEQMCQTDGPNSADGQLGESGRHWPGKHSGPIHRVVHRPSLGRRFDTFVRTHYLLENDHIPITTEDGHGQRLEWVHVIRVQNHIATSPRRDGDVIVL
jgi:hypothetical protein